MDDDFMGFDQPKRRVGRPRGSKNRDAVSLETQSRVEQVYKRMLPYMTREQKAYAEDVQQGRAGVDALKELELVIRQATFVFSESADEHWKSKRISRELSEMINAIRMSLKDFEDIKRAREEAAQSEAQVDDINLAEREAERKRIEKILAQYKEKDGSD